MISARARHRPHEGTVNLDLVIGKPLKVHERSKAGTKIVKGNDEAGSPQCLELCGDLVALLDSMTPSVTSI